MYHLLICLYASLRRGRGVFGAAWVTGAVNPRHSIPELAVRMGVSDSTRLVSQQN